MVDPPPLVRPVEGPVLTRFSYDRAAPFRRGRRRVVRLRTTSGVVVRAPCRGRVTHAGRVPGGSGVSVRCGAWSVTLTGVRAVGVRRGRVVGAGTTVGRATGPRVALGVRRADDAFGYVDPLPLLRDAGPSRRFAPLGPAPRAPRTAPEPAPVRVVPRLPAVRPGAVPAGAPSAERGVVPRGTPSTAPGMLPPADVVTAPASRTPVMVWFGLAVGALGLPAGAVGMQVRRRRAATGAAVARAGVR